MHAQTVIRVCRREWREAQVAAEENIALSTEQGFPFWVAWASANRAFSLANQGQHEAAITTLSQYLPPLRAAGSEIHLSTWFCWLAEAYLTAGRLDEALSAVAEAIAFVGKTGERVWESEI